MSSTFCVLCQQTSDVTEICYFSRKLPYLGLACRSGLLLWLMVPVSLAMLSWSAFFFWALLRLLGEWSSTCWVAGRKPEDAGLHRLCPYAGHCPPPLQELVGLKGL